MCNLTWNNSISISDIADLSMAFFALATLIFSLWQTYQMRKQQQEEERARLLFSIISYKGLFLLKISNIGKRTAYNIKIKVDGDFIENHFYKNIKKEYEELAKTAFVLTGGDSKYYYLSPVTSNNKTTHYIGEEEYAATMVNQWLEENLSSSITINGNYCDKYPVNEVVSIHEFIPGKSFVVQTVTEDSLESISEALASHKINKKSMQETLQNIESFISTISSHIAKDKK